LPQVSEILENIYRRSQQGEKLSDEEMLLLLAESLLFPRQREIIDYQKRKVEGEIDRILVVMLHMIGDVVCATPVIPALREKYPDAYIAFMVGDVAYELIKDNPLLDEVILFGERRYWFDLQGGRPFKEILDELWEFVLSLRERGFDLVIDLQMDPRVSYLVYLARPKNMEGMIVREDGQLMMAGNLWMAYKRFVHRQGTYNLLNRSETYLKMAGLNPKIRQLSIFVDEETKKKSTRIFRSSGLKEKDVLVGFNPGIGLNSPNLTWRKEEYARLGDILIKEYGAKIVIFGGPDDVQLAKEVAGLMKGRPLNLAGQTNLKELAAFACLCDHFITCDTGPMHIAGAVGTRTIVLCGPVLYGPYSGERNLILYPNLPCVGCGAGSKCTTRDCMKAITAEDVLAAFKYQREEIPHSAFRIPHSDKLTVYTSGNQPPTRLFDYCPLEPKEISCEELTDEILKYAHLNLWIEENNRAGEYEETISKEEMWEKLNRRYKIDDHKGLEQAIENRDLSKHLEFLSFLYPGEELPKAREEALGKMKRFLKRI